MLDQSTIDLMNSLSEGVYLVDLRRIITFWNRGAELLTGFRADEVVGRSCSDNLLRHVDESGRELCLTGCPLTAALMEGSCQEARVYLHHKNGSRVPVRVRVVPLRDAVGSIIGAAESFDNISSRQSLLRQLNDLQRAAFVDQLTGLGNRRYGEMIMETRLQQWQRHGLGFGLIFCDIDHFKQINDSLGHQVGDKVLAMVAATLADGLRVGDCLLRWGGEEFIAILGGVDALELGEIAERLRWLVESAWLELQGRMVRATVSLGATLVGAGDEIASLIERADGLMYAAKQAGRNQVRLG